MTAGTSFRTLDHAAEFAKNSAPHQICDTLAAMTRRNQALFDDSLDLVGSHGLMSPRARAMLDSGLVDKMRQTGLPGDRVHAGAYWIDRIETIAVELAKRLFNVAFAELRPMSCAIANGIVFAALAQRGDCILAQSRFHGADPSVTAATFGSLLGLAYSDLPYDEEALTVDADRAAEAILKLKPRLVVIGSGLVLFPYPVRRLKAAAASVGATLFYDGAHAVGLMAGRAYQSPLDEGADVVTGSAPKTLCGPTGGLILVNDAMVADSIRSMTNRLISSYPNNNVAALAVTMAEMLAHGQGFVRQVISNAQALARALDEQSFAVAAKSHGFTQTHLVLFTPGTHAVSDAVRLLEQAGLFATPIRLPQGSPFFGVRLGTTSVTRRGMLEEDMRTIAVFIRRVLIDGEAPAKIARDVVDFVSAYKKVHFCMS